MFIVDSLSYMKGLMIKIEKLCGAFVMSMLVLALFGVLGLGILATLLWVTRVGSEPKGIVDMSNFLVLFGLSPAATAAFTGSVTPSSGSAQGDILPSASHCQGYPERSVGLRVPIIVSFVGCV